MRSDEVATLVLTAVVLAGCATRGAPGPSAPPLPAAAVVATIPVGTPPTLLAMSPDGSRMFAASNGRLAIIRTDTDAVVATVPIASFTNGIAGGFGRIAVSPDGRRAFVTNQAKQYLCTTGTVEALDVASRHAVRTFAVGPSPYRFALSPDGTRGYTTNLNGPSLSILDLVGGTVIATVPVGVEPTGLAVSPDGAGCTSRATRRRRSPSWTPVSERSWGRWRPRPSRARSSSARTAGAHISRRAARCWCSTRRVCRPRPAFDAAARRCHAAPRWARRSTTTPT